MTAKERFYTEKLECKYRGFMENVDNESSNDFLEYFKSFKNDLNMGRIRAAEKIGEEWKVNFWVKQFILLGLKYGNVKEFGLNAEGRFFDKETLGQKKLRRSDKVRVTSNNVTIRDGCYVAQGVICMSPSFINIGAYIDEDTLIDSNSLVGSCSQIGKKVHISAGAQIGGVLEPIGEFPVIIEDNVFVGGNCGIYDGAIVKKGAIIGAGTIITGGVSVYDAVKGKIYSRTQSKPLVIPEGAMVVPGARIIKGELFNGLKLSVQCPIIIKYVEDNYKSIKLEDVLRDLIPQELK